LLSPVPCRDLPMEKMRLSQRCKNSAQKQSRKRTGAQKFHWQQESHRQPWMIT